MPNQYRPVRQLTSENVIATMTAMPRPPLTPADARAVLAGRVDPTCSEGAALDASLVVAAHNQARFSAEGLSGQDALAALVLRRSAVAALAGLEAALIRAARDSGIPWNDIAQAVGVESRQAAERRYLRLCADREGLDLDQRIEQERDAHAATRARRHWAHDHGPRLQELCARLLAALPDASGQGLSRDLSFFHGQSHLEGFPYQMEQAAQIVAASDPALADEVLLLWREYLDIPHQVHAAAQQRRAHRRSAAGPAEGHRDDDNA
ncbi:hypothetical protein [Catellatospora sp. NPDC049133]|uniref:hypothetical protein n=1 Tax=Catellatospora sp. NPDC049133 TaxID=3155499 RepID=UPI00340E61A6